VAFQKPSKTTSFSNSSFLKSHFSGEILPKKRNGGGVTHTQLSSKTLVRLFTGLDDHQTLQHLQHHPPELSM
jgi:hypothetical protein